MATTRCSSSGSVSTTDRPRLAMPPLETRTSKPPNRSITSATTRWLSSGEATSPWIAAAARPALLDRRDDLGGRVAIAAVGDRYVDPVFGEAEGDAPADPSTTSGDERDSVGHVDSVPRLATSDG